MKIQQSKNIRFNTIINFIFSNEVKNIPDFQAETGEIAVRYEGEKTIIYCGLGEKKECVSSTVRTSAAKAIQKSAEIKRAEVSINFKSIADNVEFQIAALEGVLLGQYKFTMYKTEKSPSFESIDLVDFTPDKNAVKKTEIICESVNYTRSLVNENASDVYPERLAEEARALSSPNLKVTVIDEKEMKRLHLELIRVVGKGSQTPPRLIIIEYNGNAGSKQKTAIVGKGITFDSGGQNLKPTGHIETMRDDMAGAADVLGIMRVLSLLKPSINVVGVICAAHNAIGSNAFFPGDVYKSYAGKTVEICSTDAEGRLILADAVSYCQKQYSPKCIIDLATLTGGILTALGEFVSGLFSNDDQLARDLFEAGEKTAERLWRFPLYKEYSDSLKSDISDLRNTSKFKKGYASSITGAAFIKEFIDGIPWAHLDIAGTTFNEGQSRGEIPQFATGFGVRLILEYLFSNK